MATSQVVVLTGGTLGPAGGTQYLISGFDNAGAPANIQTATVATADEQTSAGVSLGGGFRISCQPDLLTACRTTLAGLAAWLQAEIRHSEKLP